MDEKSFELLKQIYEAVTSYNMGPHFYIPAFGALVTVIGAIWAERNKTVNELIARIDANKEAHKEEVKELKQENINARKESTDIIVKGIESNADLVNGVNNLTSTINSKLGD